MIKIIYTCLPPKNIKMISEGEELIMNNKCKKDTMKGNKKKNKSKILPKWEKNVSPTYSTSPSWDEKEQSDMLIEKLDVKSPIEIFEMFMDEKILSENINFSKKYTDDNNPPWFPVFWNRFEKIFKHTSSFWIP